MDHRVGTGSKSTVGLVPAVLLCTAAASAAQELTGLAFAPYGMEDGLSQGSVEALLQDSTGFIWVGTHDGLNRFDGTRFTSFRSRSDVPGSLGDDYVLSLAEAGAGALWVGTERGGLHRFDTRTGQATQFAMSELGPWRTDAASTSAHARSGRTVRWIGRLEDGLVLGTDLGLVWFDPEAGAFATITGGESAQALCVTPGGVAMAGTLDGRVVPVDENGLISDLAVTLPSPVRWLTCDRDGTVYAATSSGELFGLTPTGGQVRSIARLHSDQGGPVSIRDVARTDENTLWLATGIGTHVLDERDNTLLAVTGGASDRSIPDRDAWRLLVDRTGVLWIGTWNGLATLHPLSRTMTRIFSGRGDGRLRGAGVVAIQTAPDGTAWVGSLSGGVQRIVPRPGRHPEVLDPFPENLESTVFDLALRDDRLWVAAFREGVLLQTSDRALTEVPIRSDSLLEQSVTAYSVFTDRSGDVWAGTSPLGLVRYDPVAHEFRKFRTPEGAVDLGSDWVWPIDEDAEGRLWIGAFNGGIASIAPSRDRYELHRPTSGGLSDARILTVFVDSEQDLWIGTEGGGLNHFDPDTEAVTLYTVDDGLPHDHVEGVIEDTSGFLWVTTNDGVARLDRRTGDFLRLGQASGLTGSRFYANSVHRGPDGLLYLGGDAGLTILDPGAVGSGPAVPHVTLSGFRIQGREVDLARAALPGGLDLQPDENFFAFEFALMDYADVTQNRYRYRLEPLEGDWVEAGNSPVAHYTSVPAGRYTFRVAARNGEGRWNAEALSLPVRVRAPFYETLGFRVSLLALFGSLIAATYLVRMNQLRARQELELSVHRQREQTQTLRLKIASELHDDLGGDLSTIARKAEWFIKQAGLGPEATKRADEVGALARKSADRIRETVWVVREKYDTLAALVTKMRDTADVMLAGQLEYEFEVADLPDRQLGMEVREQIYFLYKEALNNLLKHSGATKAGIDLSFDGGLTLQIMDNGCGFDPSAEKAGNGLELMARHAEAINATFELVSTVGEGTSVRLTVPSAGSA